MKKSEKYLPYLLVTPLVAIIVILIFYPIGVTLYYSFCKYKLTKNKHPIFTGLTNYINVLKDEVVGKALLNSAIIFILVLIVTIILGLIFALLLQKKTKIAGVLLAIAIIPWALPPLVSGIVWRWMFHPSFGLVNSILLHLNWITEPIQWMNSRFLLIIVISLSVAWRAVPLAALVFFSALNSIPVQLYEVADIDGCSPVKAFFRITLPLIRPTMGVVLTTTTITGINVFDEVVSLVGYSSNNATLMMETYLRSFRNMDFGNASALIYVVMIIEIIITVFYMKKVRKDVEFL